MPLDPGARLGPYEIISPLGAGGMGEVYRARDTRLAREVAVKVLPPDFASDTSRRQRFEQEARTIAALNHPNIVAIHDVGDGYIVTELIDGESLRGMKFGVRKVVDIGAQIASGLAAAHDAGIVHRDLKPDNILLTRDGRVKILDFGLAQVRAARAAAEGTQTMTVHTEPGVVMGTVGYMSPEQVRGAATDHRTDIFCLGLILHELLTGTRVFHRDTSVETMTAILKQDAPELPESIPASLRQIIARCLEKEPASRFQSARDLGFALSQSTTHTSGRAAAIPKPRKLRWPLIALAAALAGVAAGAILFRAPAPPIWSGVMLGGPEMALGPRLAPDGHLLAFLAMMDGVTQLALMKPETGNWNVLTHDRSRGPANFVKWSADGSLIYYDRYADVPEGIFTIPVVGGEEHQVIANACCPEPLPDGSLLMLRLNSQHQLQLFRFWADTGRMRDYPVLVRSDFQGETIEVTPHAREAVLVGAPLGGSPDDRRMLAVDLASATVRTLDVRLLVQSIPGYWTLSADGKSVLSLSPSGSLNHILSTPLAGGPSRSLFTTTEDVRSLNAGVDGSIYGYASGRPAELLQLTASGEQKARLASVPRAYEFDTAALLPDGRVAVTEFPAGRARIVAVASGKDASPLINTPEETSSPMTMVGTNQLAFALGKEPRQTIAIADLASGRISSRLTPAKGELKNLAASPDGKILYFSATNQIWSIAAGGGEAKFIHAGNSAVVEPDGRGLIVSLFEVPRARLFRVPLDGGAEREIMMDGKLPLSGFALTSGAIDAHGRLLVPLNPVDSWFNPIGIVDTATGSVTRLPSDNRSDHHTMLWTRDGQIITIRMGFRAALWKFTPAP